jgi:hypothetical protein
MTYLQRSAIICSAISALSFLAPLAHAHGFVGDRFFPATVTTDDPLATDELALPTLSIADTGGTPDTQDTAVGFEFDKIIVPHLTIGVSDEYNWLQSAGQRTERGFDDLTLLTKYELFQSPAHEFILSIGMETDLGGTGSKSVGRDSFTTFTPTLYFGKGFGDLPDALDFFKPFAVTGTFGVSIPTEAAAANSIEWGLALEYNLPYLQQHVKDIGLPAPFKNMIPLVEFTGESPFNRGGGITTGTINPGVLFESRYYQVGVEALIPINGESGNHVGAIVSLEIYIDDLFPKVFGHAIFGN